MKYYIFLETVVEKEQSSIEKELIVTLEIFVVEWVQTSIIHSGLTVLYDGFIKNISNFVKTCQRLIKHSNFTGASGLNQLWSHVVRILEMLAEFLDFCSYAIAMKKGWYTVAEFCDDPKEGILESIVTSFFKSLCLFPTFNLEDKVRLAGVGIDGPMAPWAYYKRRSKVNGNNVTNVVSKATTK